MNLTPLIPPLPAASPPNLGGERGVVYSDEDSFLTYKVILIPKLILGLKLLQRKTGTQSTQRDFLCVLCKRYLCTLWLIFPQNNLNA
jgi:hypothetical protein